MIQIIRRGLVAGALCLTLGLGGALLASDFAYHADTAAGGAPSGGGGSPLI